MTCGTAPSGALAAGIMAPARPMGGPILLRVAAGLGLILVALGAFAQTRDRTLSIAPAGTPPEARYALVIGNSAYTSGPLRNPVNDARAMAKALAGAGFHVRVVE